jgi:hypothetical protein
MGRGTFSGIGLTFADLRRHSRGILHGDIRKFVLDMEDMSWLLFSSNRDELCVCVGNDGGSDGAVRAVKHTWRNQRE